MKISLKDARILLTGASSGIGRALALELARHGAKLALVSRQKPVLDDLARLIEEQGGTAVVVPADVTNAEQRQLLVAAAVESLGGLDILINNAGVGARGWFTESSPETLRPIMEVNFFAAAELTRLAIPHLKKGRDPMLVNVSSAVGRRGLPGCAEYCASKFALTGWSESLRGELVNDNIHVMIVSPGAIQTGFRDNLLADRGDYGAMARQDMTAERCAQIIVRGMRCKALETVITIKAKALVWGQRFLPGLVDWLLRRHVRSHTPSPRKG
jgi:short-subunit dehydrogenase